MHIKNAIILCTCLIMNYLMSNTFESPSNTGYALVISAMYMWRIKQSGIDRAIWCFYFDVIVSL